MSDTTYVDGVTTMVADSLNDFNRLTYTIFADPANIAAVRALVTPAYIYIREEQTAGTAGGTFTSGAWQKRTLNTEVNDAGGYASISSSVIALLAGTYRFKASAPAFAVDTHKVKLKNTSDTIEYVGDSGYALNTGIATTRSSVSGRFTIAGTKNFEVQHYCGTTRSTDGFGVASNFAVVEVYAEIELWRE